MSGNGNGKKSKKTGAKKPTRKQRKERKNNVYTKSNGKFAEGNPGRPKGSKNKKPAILVDKILEVEEYLSAQGKGLKECATQDPKWFFEKLLAKILPKPIDVTAEHDGEIIIRWLK